MGNGRAGRLCARILHPGGYTRNRAPAQRPSVAKGAGPITGFVALETSPGRKRSKVTISMPSGTSNAPPTRPIQSAGSWLQRATAPISRLAVGERRWSRVELDEAEHLASEVDWTATTADSTGATSEERFALLVLAELFCDIDPARSSMYLARYRDLGPIRYVLSNPRDVRLTAREQYSTGVVELALGNRKRGLAGLRDARKVFERIGYDFRAANCLVAEYRVTGDRDLVPAIEEKLRHYQQSWLSSEFRSATAQPRPPLPPMQQRVFEELCHGKSTAEIARSLERSEYTVSNHIKEIFKAFDVKSRSALLAKAVRQGMVSSSPTS